MNRTLLSLALAAAASGVASAHGPQMQITVTGGKIVTRDLMIDVFTPLTSPRSVYVMPAVEVADIDFPTAWRAGPDTNPVNPNGPGIAYGVGGTFAPGSTLTLAFLEELKLWDGTAFVSASATELAMLRTANPGPASLTGNAGFSGGADPSATITIPASYADESHNSVTYVLLGDGMNPASPVADGLYRTALRFTSSDAAVAPSDPFYLLISKRAETQLGAAIASMGVDPSAVQYLAIPEPSALVLAALGAVGLRRRARA